MQIEMNIFKGRLKEKLKKRCKIEEVESKIVGKVQYQEFIKNSQKIHESFKLLENRINHVVGIQKVETQKALDKKADNRELELLKKVKVDIESF